jgi:signal transduction histidine kinase/DNA-binding NarL/FixJ family response regulator
MRVLIAEDDPSTRHLLRRLFSEWGHTVLTASDADEAWAEVVAAQPPHVVLLDEGLAKGGGMGLCRLIHDLPTRPQMHVVLSMAIIDSNSLIAAFDAGADDLLEKPFDLADLRVRVMAGYTELRARLKALHVDDGALSSTAAPPPPAAPGEHPATVGETTGETTDGADRARALSVFAKAPPCERQHAALSAMAKSALGGASLREFSEEAAAKVAEVLSAERVQLLERRPDGTSLAVRTTAGRHPKTALPSDLGLCLSAGGHQISVEIGPEPHPYGVMTLEVDPLRRLFASEIEFFSSVAHLVGMVAQRERLETQIQQAQKMEVFGRLAGGIAHDFNNVLAVIGTGVAAVQGRAECDAELAEDIDLIGQGVERGRLLARRLLRFSRTPSEPPALVSLNQIVSDGQAMLERILVGQVALVTDIPATPLVVSADRGEVEQILMNLVLNARDAMPSGGVIRVSMGAGQPKSALSDVRYASFTVADNGVGMDASTKARMFEPFFTTKPPGSGTGLGLSTVKEIVRRAEGCVEVESTPGQGTAITVYWPRADEAGVRPALPAPAPSSSPLPRRGSRKSAA